jgi:3',5'-nucleoside bisphosphate phosphatase
LSGKIDLHLHSLESDGRLSPADLVELAWRNGVRRLALTDHDTTGGVVAARDAGRRLGVEVLAGIEINTDIPGSEVHVLGLFLDLDQPEFQARLAEFRAGRVGRAEAMVAKLTALGYPITWERVRELAGNGAVGRPHVAQALLEAGHVASIPEAFERFIGRTGPAYAERSKLLPSEAIALIQSVGGLAVLAHPLEGDGVRDLIADLAGAGLDGVECYYQGYGPDQVASLVTLTRGLGLVPTGGSDYHGFPMGGQAEVRNEPGSVEIPPELLDELVDRRHQKFGS